MYHPLKKKNFDNFYVSDFTEDKIFMNKEGHESHINYKALARTVTEIQKHGNARKTSRRSGLV